MGYCTNCGKELKENVKFCTFCGTKTGFLKKDVKKPLMYKRESKSIKDRAVDLGKKTLQNNTGKRIQDETADFVKSKAEDAFTSDIPKEKPIQKPISETKTIEKETVSDKKSFNKWTWIYIIINGLLVLLGSQSDEVLGVLIFSILILGIVFFRRKTAKPYNWFVKIIQVIQIVFLFALIAEGIAYFSVFTLVFIALLLTNVILLFKGNKN